ncbi:hypothetical protein ACHAQA_006268 [Verticillium albo-atrum]
MTTGTFKYIDLDSFTGKPWGKVDVDKTSFQRTERTRPVADIRAAGLDSFSTDTSGFGVYHAPATEKEFTDDDAVRGGYYAEIEGLLRAKLTGVRKVVIFDHTIRRRIEGAPRQPVQQLHVDQTPWAAEARVRRHVEDAEEAERLIKGRFQIINVWRPIGHAASDFPLAVVDWRTTRPEDLIKVDLLYPVREAGDDGDDRGKEALPDAATIDSTDGYEAKGETYAVAPSDAHKFYYVKDMTPEEAMFIKCFDSRSQGLPGGRDGLAGLTPHTAFVDPQTPEGAKGRQSIEVRCLVFYEDEA